jgi:branched-chain amino acid transport system substrate-binding protein
MSNIPETTPYPPVGGFYYRLLHKSPLGDLGVRIFQVCLTLVILLFACPYPAISQINNIRAGTIKIGFLIQDSSCTSAIQGAEMAVSIANLKGGLNGRHFQLVTRSMEGPWGTGSKQAVNLIFEEKVWALIGSHDGRNAHLVEQAATKSQVVFVSAWSGDPTLSQAFVPWFFNCIPNDRQQVSSLIEEIYNKKKFNKVAVVSGNDYDSKTTLASFLKSVEKSEKPDPVQFNYEEYRLNLSDLSDEIKKAKVNCIVLFCPPEAAVKLARQIIRKKMDLPLYGSIMLLNENELSHNELEVYDNILSVPSGYWPETENQIFRQKYQKIYKKYPGMVAIYSYDGMSVVIEAIKNAANNDREVIQKSLENINLKGVTGPVRFDEKGNRIGNFETVKIKDGVPVSWEKEFPR